MIINKKIYLLSVCVFITALLPDNSTIAMDDVMGFRQSFTIDSVITGFQREHCCSGSVAGCKEKPDTCSITNRLYAFSQWMIQSGYENSKIIEQLERRYDGFVATKQYAIDTSNLQWAGASDAPVRIIAYISTTCGMCKKVVGDLFDSITVGSLSGKVKLMAVPFGIGIGDIGLYAANSEGKFWQLFQVMRENKIRYVEDDIINMARKAGIAENTFRTLLKKDQFRQMKTNARVEGFQNGVEVTPTFFINEKKYNSYKDPKWIIDAALFELEKVNKKK